MQCNDTCSSLSSPSFTWCNVSTTNKFWHVFVFQKIRQHDFWGAQSQTTKKADQHYLSNNCTRISMFMFLSRLDLEYDITISGGANYDVNPTTRIRTVGGRITTKSWRNQLMLRCSYYMFVLRMRLVCVMFNGSSHSRDMTTRLNKFKLIATAGISLQAQWIWIRIHLEKCRVKMRRNDRHDAVHRCTAVLMMSWLVRAWTFLAWVPPCQYNYTSHLGFQFLMHFGPA